MKKIFMIVKWFPVDDTNLIFKAHAIGCDIIAKDNHTVEFSGANAFQEAKHLVLKKIAKKLANMTTNIEDIFSVSSYWMC